MTAIRVPSLDGGQIDSYLAFPKSGSGPGLIVVHEVFGLSPAIQTLCDHYASLGYVVLCPNLFWRDGTATGTDQMTGEPDWDQTSKLYKNFDVEAGVRDLLAAVAYLRRLPECGGKVGMVGYCLGCRLAFLLAARSDIDCAVGYYGVGLESYLDEAPDIRMPFLLHVGEQDKFIPPFARKQILRAAERNPVLRVELYPNAEHGFAREDSPKHHGESASLAYHHTKSFLEKCLFN